MRIKARIEGEIAALATEVRELARRRGAGMPDVQTLVGFIVAVFGIERAREVGLAVCAEGEGALARAVAELQIAPGAEALRACVLTVFGAIGRGDYSAYRHESEALRESLLALLEARAPKWRHLWAAREFYPVPAVQRADPVEHVRAAVAKLTRWEVLVWAGHALACAVEDVWLWRLWEAGWREYQEESRQRGQIGTAEAAWQRQVAEHTLPEAEAQIVDSWAMPPDSEWPKGNIKLSLFRLREWQAKQGGLDAEQE